MHWDKRLVAPVIMPADRRRAVLAWLSPEMPPPFLAAACDLAGLDIYHSPDLADCLAGLAQRKPDLLVHDVAISGAVVDFTTQIAQARATANLPLLRYEDDPRPYLGLGPQTDAPDAFVTIRASLRRERPSALKGSRSAGPFMLDETGFKLCLGLQCATLTKTDLAILGPFFDLPNARFERADLQRLVFGSIEARADSRTLDAHISRARRHVIAQLGRDPLRTLRGTGYALALDAAEICDISGETLPKNTPPAQNNHIHSPLRP